MKKANRAMALALSALLSIGILSGCGTEGGTGKTDVVRVWTNDAHSKEIITEMVTEYNETIGKKEGIRIEYTVYGSDFNNVLNMALQNDDAAELFKSNNDVRDLVEKGNLMPLENLPGMESFLKGYEGYLVEGTNVVEGKTYHVPFQTTTVGLIYNKDMFKAAGIVDENGEAKAPETWAEMREVAKKLTDASKKQYGFAFPMKWSSVFNWDLRKAWGASLQNATSVFNYSTGKYDYKPFKAAMEWLLAVKEDGSCFPGAEGLDNDAARAQFAEGRVGMMIGASWDVGVFNEQFVAKCDWGVAKVPVENADKRYKGEMSAGPLLAVNAKIDEDMTEKVAKVYQWFNSDDFLKELFEAGKVVPYKPEIIANASLENAQKGWKEFAALVDYSMALPITPKIKLNGDSEYIVFSKIWSGSVSVDEGLADIEKRSNEALEGGIADGSINIDDYIIPDFGSGIIEVK